MTQSVKQQSTNFKVDTNSLKTEPKDKTQASAIFKRDSNELPEFSLAAEIGKSFTRELFFVQTQVIDNVCAALLHLTQSERVGRSYYRDRRQRLFEKPVLSQAQLHTTNQNTPEDLFHLKPRDKLLEVHLNQSLLGLKPTSPLNLQHQQNSDLSPTKRNRSLSFISTGQLPHESMFEQQQKEKAEETGHLAMYINDYYKAMEAQKRNARAKLLYLVKRFTSQVLAVISIYFPSLLFIRKQKLNKKSPVRYISIFDREPLQETQTSNPDPLTQAYNNSTGKTATASSQQMQLAQYMNDIDTMAELLVTLDPVTTGFSNDLQLIIQLGIDKSVFRFNCMMKGISDIVSFCFNPSTLGSGIKSEQLILAIDSCYKYGVEKIKRCYQIPYQIMTRGIDNRSFKELIEDVMPAGVLYKRYEVTTEDGIILQLHRLARPESFHVVYFQHGVMDSAQSWITQGRSSIGHKALNMGYDVWMGSIRGIYPRKCTVQRQRKGDYWDFSLDEVGKYDLAAFIKKILQVKKAELEKRTRKCKKPSNVQKQIKITYIGHSMGGAVLPIYVIQRRKANQQHYLSKAILVSPAGFHTHGRVTIYLQAFGKFCTKVLPLFSDRVAIPDFLFGLSSKVLKDLTTWPAVRDLLTYSASLVLGGASTGESFLQSTRVASAILRYGCGLNVPRQIVSQFECQRFIGMDHGSAEENLRVHGTVEPIDYGEHYGLIDIPISLFIAMNDRLIRADDVLRHYETLKKFGKGHLANVRVFDGIGHVDVNYKQAEALVVGMQDELRQGLYQQAENSTFTEQIQVQSVQSEVISRD